jgi:uncharacterized protein YwqG
LPENGLLSFFIDPYGFDAGKLNCQVLYFNQESKLFPHKRPSAEEIDYNYLDLLKKPRLIKFKKEISFPDMYSKVLSEMDWSESEECAYRHTLKAVRQLWNDSNRLLGQADWIQDDVLEKGWELLLQLEIDDLFYFLIPSSDLVKKDFNNVNLEWQYT